MGVQDRVSGWMGEWQSDRAVTGLLLLLCAMLRARWCICVGIMDWELGWSRSWIVQLWPSSPSPHPRSIHPPVGQSNISVYLCVCSPAI